MFERKNHVSKDVLASKGTRLGNYIIDLIIQYVIIFLIGVVSVLFGELTGNYVLYDFIVESDSTILDYILGYIIAIIYYSLIESVTDGRSLGKFITKTKVVNYEGEKPSFNTILVRSLCRCIPFDAFSFLGDDGKGWHDSISKTYVVDIKKFEDQKETALGLEQIGKQLTE